MGLLERLSDLGARPGDSRDERLRYGTLIFASLLIAIISLLWVVTYLSFGYARSAAIPAFYQLTTVVGLVALERTRRFDVFRTTQLLVMLVSPALLQATLGGFVASSGMVLWAIFVPLAALALVGIRRSLWWLAAFCVELAVLALLDPVLSRDPAALPPSFVISFFVLNIMGVTVSAYVMLAYFVEQRARAHRALEAERERSSGCLLNVLPAPIAERLKRRADRHRLCSTRSRVLFADIVGFTMLSSRIEPDELVHVLDEHVLGVRPARDEARPREDQDDRRRLHGRWRAPRAAAGSRGRWREWRSRCANEITRSTSGAAQGWLDVRIGIHTGPVVAGVIGRRSSPTTCGATR